MYYGCNTWAIELSEPVQNMNARKWVQMLDEEAMNSIARSLFLHESQHAIVVPHPEHLD
jgi:hypothetical protein